MVLNGKHVAILNFGARMNECKKASEVLKKKGITISIFDARFAKPLDKELIIDLVKNHELLLTVEEGSSGGFGAHVLLFLADNGYLDDGLKIRNLYLPDVFIQHGDMDNMYEQAGLGSDNIVKTALIALGINDSEFKIIKS